MALTVDDYEIQLTIERQCRERTAAVKRLLHKSNRPDLLDEFGARLRDIALGTDSARSCWHSLSSAQRRVLEIMDEGRWLVRKLGTQYDAHGEPHALENVCRLPTVRKLLAHDLCELDGGAFDPERKIVLTERGRFVLAHGRTEASA